MSFPEPADRLNLSEARQTERLAHDLEQWIDRHAPQRQGFDTASISAGDQAALRELRRTSENVTTSARFPAAAAVYGPSQVGKSLFVGRITVPADADHSALGRDERLGEPAYYAGLSFDADLNPQSGSNEATALVTRFTTSTRMPADVPIDVPVVARALTRRAWLKVLARGFLIECAAVTPDWDEATMTSRVTELARRFPAPAVDVSWRADLLDAYAATQIVEPRRFSTPEVLLGSLLLIHPLSPDGYVELAAQLFWDGWRSLTALFLRVTELIASLPSENDEPMLLVPWQAVRFLLDSRRMPTHERRTSHCFQHVEWSDFRLGRTQGRAALEYRPGWGGGCESLELIQASLIELMIPVLPHRLQAEWRAVLEAIDVLDVPGLRSGRQGAEQGKRRSADTLDEQLEIVKRGKTAMLFEHYTQEFQIQTLLVLVRGGNLEVTGSMKYHIHLWGQSRYGRERWTTGAPLDPPALFLGMTGIDEEFRLRAEPPDARLYDTRLAQLVDALGSVMSSFGGSNSPFTNVLPLRYPGTWDATQIQQAAEGLERWERAREVFLRSKLVQRHVAQSEERWNAAMNDTDGGMSLIAAGWKAATSSVSKQSQLRRRVGETQVDLLQLARGWVVDPQRNLDRERRARCAQAILEWLTSEPPLLGRRAEALRRALTVEEGEQYDLSDSLSDSAAAHRTPGEGVAPSITTQLRTFWERWSGRHVPRHWQAHIETNRNHGPWLDDAEVMRLSGYLRDYFCLAGTLDVIGAKLQSLAQLRLPDERAMREARRRFVRLILNDLALTPGCSPIVGDAGAEVFASSDPFAGLVQRWRRTLPAVVCAGAGGEVRIPAGNDQLVSLLEQFDSRAATTSITTDSFGL